MSIYKTKNAAELRKLSTEDLRKRVLEISETQMILMAQRVQGKVNPGQWRNIKKEKARILTILGERKNPGKGGFRRR